MRSREFASFGVVTRIAPGFIQYEVVSEVSYLILCLVSLESQSGAAYEQSESCIHS